MKKLLLNSLVIISSMVYSQTFNVVDLPYDGSQIISGEMGDFDNDGDLDILYVDGNSASTKISRNDNGTFVDIGVEMYYGHPHWGDYDNDGDLDIGIAGTSKIVLYKNNNGTFVEDQTYHFVPATKEIWKDIDNDGDIDLLIAGYSSNYSTHTAFLINNSGSFELFYPSFYQEWYRTIDAADYDNDGDIDILFSKINIEYLFNNDTLNFTTASSTFLSSTPFDITFSNFVDYDLDGDLDIISTGKETSTPYDEYTRIYENQNNTFVESSIEFEYDYVGRNIKLADIDNDGDYDFLYFGNSYLTSEINNNGTYELSHVFPSVEGLTSGSAEVVDINNDGFLDYMYIGHTVLNSNNVSKILLNSNGNTLYSTNTPPSVPTNLQANVIGNEIIFSWDSSTDAQTPSISITYNLRVGTSPGGNEIFSAMANSNGRLLTPHNGNCDLLTSHTINNLGEGIYYWSVQAIDNGRMSSVFATEQQVSIVTPVDIPTLISPTDSSFNQNYNLTFDWHKVDNAVNYKIQIAYDNNFDNLVVDSIISDTLISINNFTLETSCFWRVKAYSVLTESSWSEISYFKTDDYFTDINASLPTYEKDLDVDWGDYDNDGDLDLLITGYFSSNIYGAELYQNNDSVFTPININLNNYSPEVINWIDLDNDNNLDILIKETHIGIILHNIDGNFSQPDTIFDLFCYGDLDYCDFDNDGDIDILGGGGNTITPSTRILVNNDTAFTLKYVYPGLNYSSVAWGDYTNSNRWDFIANGETDLYNSMTTKHITNNNGVFSQTSTNVTKSSRGYIKSFDYDSDGDLDILINGLRDQYANEAITRLYNNSNGTFTNTNFVFEGTPYSLSNFNYSDLIWGDYDNDGDNDIMVGETGGIYRNDNNIYTTTEINFSNIGKHFAWADYDNDGDLDLVITRTNAECSILKNNSYISNTNPQEPISNSTNINSGRIELNWERGTDNETPQNGLTYNIYIKEISDSNFIMSPSADIVTGYRKLAKKGNVHQRTSSQIDSLQEGTYIWSVQSVDNTFHGSVFCVPDTFTVISAPILYLPENDSLLLNPQINFSWYGVNNAIGYKVQVSSDSLFTNILLDSNVIDTNFLYAINLSLNISNYYWRISSNTNNGNSFWSDVRNFNLPECDLISDFTYIDNGNGNFSFTNTSVGNFNKNNWYFGDGTISSEFDVNHTFSSDGDYIVVLNIIDTVYSNICFDYKTEVINVTGVQNPTSCNAGFVCYPDSLTNNVWVINSSTGNNLSYLWNFGDGDTSNLAYPSHSYSTYGPYYLCLTVNDDAGCSSTFCDSISSNATIFKSPGFIINVVAPNMTIANKIVHNQEITIYPNPTSGKLFIDYDFAKSTNAKIKIYNLVGELIKIDNIENSKGIYETDFSNFARGIYYVNISNDEFTKTVRVVYE